MTLRFMTLATRRKKWSFPEKMSTREGTGLGWGNQEFGFEYLNFEMLFKKEIVGYMGVIIV